MRVLFVVEGTTMRQGMVARSSGSDYQLAAVSPLFSGHLLALRLRITENHVKDHN